MKLDKYTVGKRYGKALFELAVERDKEQEIYQELMTLRSIYQEIPDLGFILSDARLEPYEKDIIFKEVVQAFDGIFADFLRVVYDYHRMDDIPLIIDEYEHRMNEHHQTVLGRVVTAIPLQSDQLLKIEQAVSKEMGYAKAFLVNEIDPEVIGGFFVEANHQVMDGTVRTQIKKLYQNLVVE